jgi:hypothetical protein
VRRWLITTPKETDLRELRGAITAQGGIVGDESPIPLGPVEQVVEAEGPDDLPARLQEHPAVLKVSPDSPKHPYS